MSCDFLGKVRLEHPWQSDHEINSFGITAQPIVLLERYFSGLIQKQFII